MSAPEKRTAEPIERVYENARESYISHGGRGRKGLFVGITYQFLQSI